MIIVGYGTVGERNFGDRSLQSYEEQMAQASSSSHGMCLNRETYLVRLNEKTQTVTVIVKTFICGRCMEKGKAKVRYVQSTPFEG
jgi:hypothetical protein